MAKTVDISMDSIKEFFSSIPEKLTELWDKIMHYFQSITLYQQIAWGVLALGLILFILAFVL